MNSDNKYKLTMLYPASWWKGKWRDALPSGNGTIGAAVYGAISEETIMITHEDLWWKSVTMDLPDVSDKLPEVRKLLFEGKAKEADRIMANALRERGYHPRIGYPLPLGDLKIKMPCVHGFKNYRRILNMETGEVKVCWQDGSTSYERNLFVSRADDMIVYEICSSGVNHIDASITLDLHDRNDIMKHFNRQATLPEQMEVRTDGSFIYYAARNDNGSDFGAVAKVISRDGHLMNDDDNLKVSETNNVLVYIKLFINGERIQQWKRLKQELESIDQPYEELLKKHVEIHGQLFHRMSLDLYAEGHERSNEQLLMEAYQGNAPNALIEKMWAYGRYLLVSSSHENGQPCHLYGLWCGEYEGMWAINMANENLQMIYWQTLSGNMPEMLLTVFDYFERMMDDFRTNARQLYNCRGIYIPAVTVPDSGLLKTISPHIIHWTGAAGWIAQHYYDYYLYTGDVQFLRDRALPFLRETALFYEDFFLVGEDGYYISCPSNSPENTPGNYWDGRGMGSSMETTINATMDFAIAKEVLTHLIEGAQICGKYEEEVEKWKSMLKRIPPYQINDDGAVKEWMHPYFEDNYHHRHQSHIYPVFPGTEVTRTNNPELFEGFVTAVKKRLTIGLKEQTGWSLAHMANNYARMGEGDLALECLNLLSRSCVNNNFLTFHNDWRRMGIGVDMEWAPVQLDANMGFSAAVQEMLLFSVPGQIHILPALPTSWKKGRVKNMLARGNVTVSMEWDQGKETVHVELVSASDQQVQIIPFGKQEAVNVQLLQNEAKKITLHMNEVLQRK